ncbi:MAG TPA: ABC transporter ATP-binding protein [Candidatus Flavonifractor merdigallinarum]|uniref:ABC transporter ATP-binding protein n=1 Tax=Candidatus Flavonifractor merdigallinarum TaxID=2838589 RepID=A0A9D1Y9P6_9FIRM|nr:ABC transporter ATP-binding protein [Candidatus Flavonifractor merdigallinarum]
MQEHIENTNAPILEVKDLNVIYKTDLETVYAINGISFALDKGKTMGLVGETGAGKTTTALAILGLLPERVGRVTQGEIFFDGDNLCEKKGPELRKYRGDRISMIFQDPMTSLNPVMTVGDQICESLQLHTTLSKEDQQKRVDEILELVGIPANRKVEYPHQFSGGMKQRVVIAMALACSPELLIADEPTTALDVTIQAQILDMMLRLKRELNTSMIFISHDLAVVYEICDTVAIMYAGEIIESGTTKEVYFGQHHHPYTKGLFDSIPSLTEDVDRLKPIEGLMPDPSALPTGCKFHPRCTHCMEICKRENPPLFVEGTHSIRCHLFSNSEPPQKGGEET